MRRPGGRARTCAVCPRGPLPSHRRPAATAISAVVFGIWHVRPTLAGLAANDLVGGPVVRVVAVVSAGAFTAVAGALFAWLRLRSGSLLAPVLLHLATNTLGTVAAAVANRPG